MKKVKDRHFGEASNNSFFTVKTIFQYQINIPNITISLPLPAPSKFYPFLFRRYSFV
jgi:hypothetical protein